MGAPTDSLRPRCLYITPLSALQSLSPALSALDLTHPFWHTTASSSDCSVDATRQHAVHTRYLSTVLLMHPNTVTLFTPASVSTHQARTQARCPLINSLQRFLIYLRASWIDDLSISDRLPLIPRTVKKSETTAGILVFSGAFPSPIKGPLVPRSDSSFHLTVPCSLIPIALPVRVHQSARYVPKKSSSDMGIFDCARVPQYLSSNQHTRGSRLWQ